MPALSLPVFQRQWRNYTQSPTLWLILATSIFFISIFLLNLFEEYRNIQAQVARAELNYGATVSVLGNGLWSFRLMVILWSIACGAGLIAEEKQERTLVLLRLLPDSGSAILLAKAAALFLLLQWTGLLYAFFVVLSLPYVAWDLPLCLAQWLSLELLALYGSMLALFVSSYSAGSLLSGLLLLLFWLLIYFIPDSVGDVYALEQWLQWFSPFAHADLLAQGILSLQTLWFLLIHLLAFFTLSHVQWFHHSGN